MVNQSSSKQPNFTADEFNSYLAITSFSSASSILSRRNDQPSSMSRSGHRIIPSGNQFSFRNVSEIEVASSILKIRSNAVGLDNIHLVFIKIILPFVLCAITHVYNRILTRSLYPLD